MTIVGSAIWCYILAYLGDKAFHLRPDLIQNPDAMVEFIKSQSLWIVLLIVVFAALYFVVMRLSARRSTSGCVLFARSDNQIVIRGITHESRQERAYSPLTSSGRPAARPTTPQHEHQAKIPRFTFPPLAGRDFGDGHVFCFRVGLGVDHAT